MKALADQAGILKRMSDGDEKAFSVFFAHYHYQLRPLIFKFTKSAEDADEVLQETFVRVWLHRDRLTEIEHLNAWLHKVATRECLSYLRKQLGNLQNTSLVIETDQMISPHTPFEVMQHSETSQLIRRAIDQMPPQRKLIYQLSREEGLMPAEIAEKLSLSVSTVKNVLSTSLKDIRAFLRDHGLDLGTLTLLLSKFF